ncbi:uncharacterized protein LOC143696599 isoform X5 [Agelaius phoeniceus]|uniref:uncharacterized protein LOC143696599 isoform X5 n=1 Tax=Agelaius phoeniceus TaxID=39638 RepID=UPI004054F20B
MSVPAGLRDPFQPLHGQRRIPHSLATSWEAEIPQDGAGLECPWSREAEGKNGINSWSRQLRGGNGISIFARSWGVAVLCGGAAVGSARGAVPATAALSPHSGAVPAAFPPFSRPALALPQRSGRQGALLPRLSPHGAAGAERPRSAERARRHRRLGTEAASGTTRCHTCTCHGPASPAFPLP